MSKLFTPLKLGSAELGHRIAMAPMTRFRNADDNVPAPLVREYYEQRASIPGTLIVTEATLISPSAGGGRLPNVPGIWSDAQVAAWRTVTEAVHARGSFIYCQLWHLGRAGNGKGTDAQGGPIKLVSSSAIPISADFAVPVALPEEEIWKIVADYVAAARNAIAAGFDGVEIHGANGYLLDQFLQDTCNRRTDAWGGSIENRSRFPLEVTKAVIAAVGAHRTGIRLSPYSNFQGMLMEDPDPTFRYLATQLRALGLGYLHLIEARISGPTDSDCGGQRSVEWLVKLWDNASPVLLAGGFKPETARKAADETYAAYDVIIVFGRYFVSNPDLVFRIREGIELVQYDRSVFYKPKLPKGYIDYPFSPQFEAAKA